MDPELEGEVCVPTRCTALSFVVCTGAWQCSRCTIETCGAQRGAQFLSCTLPSSSLSTFADRAASEHLPVDGASAREMQAPQLRDRVLSQQEHETTEQNLLCDAIQQPERTAVLLHLVDPLAALVDESQLQCSITA